MKFEYGEQFTPKRVLVVGAHADDIDVTAGGTVAVWTDAGAVVEYVVITDGGKGATDTNATQESVTETRKSEQRSAAQTLGAGDVHFLGYEDSNLEVTQELKKDLVRLIRQFRPDTVITLDPTMVYSSELGIINHSDHRAAGQATLDAVYPLARDHLTFPDLQAAGLAPHKVAHVLLVNFEKQNCYIDVSAALDRKITALAQHASQFKDMTRIKHFVTMRAAAAGEKSGFAYAEGFMRIDISI